MTDSPHTGVEMSGDPTTGLVSLVIHRPDGSATPIVMEPAEAARIVHRLSELEAVLAAGDATTVNLDDVIRDVLGRNPT